MSLEEPVEPDPVIAEALAVGDEDTTYVLASSSTVRHDYVTQGGKVVRETITDEDGNVQILDFIYDTAGQPYALVYKANAIATPETYYYVLNLQGDVVKLIKANGATVAEYTYNARGEVISSMGLWDDPREYPLDA